ncbi:arsenate reductase (glutaredoxin) [Lentiprolixibacter aurantiacus]|uniref:Arsenate reductase (Glutaredoxin) n=1 Tax=Lentiprolixibacter aurantiacus TaxID=2993939 RepID=A0AAE3SNF1_9FLAO|nr:arsenate reductase (glutaredoxin) [Lentiprolixibacter aurantiacus]MCX2719460.1 arsenate reductase (glutaredoxin) [Lentiprolixibacter aurantiacus]
MIKIYHNPRCRKSREGLAFLEKSGEKFEIVRYLDNPLTREEITALLKALNISPIDLVRKNEAIWKSDYKGKELSDSQLIAALAEHPKLIERPIVLMGNKAVIARPADKINELL